MPQPLTPWTESRLAVLVHLWEVSGMSAAVIAKQLGGTSRNAVLGKLMRMGKLGERRGPVRRRTSKHNGARPKPERRLPILRHPARLPVTRSPMPIMEDVPPLTRSIQNLRDGQCRWPIGDPRRPGFGFCGCPIWHGSYCAHHYGIAYQPQ